ncbi:MAG: transposase, partial [Methylococcaceae bacterium]|nr:transposase [Methylococcaceae bacterium]
MSQKFTEGFKMQAIEKALSRSPGMTLVEMAETLGVSRSALQRWITQSKNQQLETSLTAMPTMTNKEKR